MHHGAALFKVDAAVERTLDVVTIVPSDAWTGRDAFTVSPPNRILDAQAISAALPNTARPLEAEDVISSDDAADVGLGMGWAPREYVNEQPMRWIGHRAHLHLAGEGPRKKVKIRGVAGPCLGRGARLDLLVGSRRVDSCPIDVEDGQRFSATFKLDDSARAARTVTLQVHRPRPRYTPHDVRVLNLLVAEVTVR